MEEINNSVCGGNLADGDDISVGDNGIPYVRVGDYLLPLIGLSDPPDAPPLGYYGLRRKAFLKEHRLITYNQLLLSEQFFPHCREVDEAAATRLAVIGDHEIAHDVILNELVNCRHLTL